MPLVEGLKNEVVCRDNRIRELVHLRLIPMQEAICEALTQIRQGPGNTITLNVDGQPIAGNVVPRPAEGIQDVHVNAVLT